MAKPMIIVLMGVAGSGKTTLGRLLSQKLQWPFYDADDFHPPANIEKMAAGVALTDDDRWPWLTNLRQKMKEENEAGRSAIFACSALKQSYRDFLTDAGEEVRLVFLKGEAGLIERRIAGRTDHFMKAGMLASQLATLEEPQGCVTVDVSAPAEMIADEIVRALGKKEER
jgi:gluconokinase